MTRKQILVVMMAGVLLGGCSLVPKKSGIEIMTYPTAKVFINGKESGMTPYKNSSLKPGEVEIKLVLSGSGVEWQKNVKLENYANTVIDWEFGGDEKTSGGYVLYLEKTGDKNKAGLIVNNLEDKAAVLIDGEIKGRTPLRMDNIEDGDRQITVSLPGYKSKTIYAKAIKGFGLVVESDLGIDNGVVEEVVVPTNTPGRGEVIIKETETGWLRVRQSPEATSAEVAKIKPKERYVIEDEVAGWIKIALPDGKTSGWISSKYADKLE